MEVGPVSHAGELMPYYVWLCVNAVFLIASFVLIWFFRLSDSLAIVLGQFAAQAAIVLFLVNVNMYFIFLVIRKSRERSVKIRLSRLSRRAMKWHIPIALTGSMLILIHASIMLKTLGETIGYVHGKMISGYLSLMLLALTVFAGWLRRLRASGTRRKFHLVSALVFAAAFIVHLFFPLQ
jgi:hypothetical protein